MIGRWNVVGFLSKKMESFSPYNYVLNNPFNLIAPTGTEPEDVCSARATPLFMISSLEMHL